MSPIPGTRRPAMESAATEMTRPRGHAIDALPEPARREPV